MTKQEKYIKKNHDLAFTLTVKLIKDYANKCQTDPDKNMMDPILGTYNLINQLYIPLVHEPGSLKHLAFVVVECCLS